MNTSNIIRAANDIEEHKAALKWLREYGDRLKSRDGYKLSITLHHAGSCAGAREAEKILEAYASFALSDVVKTAITSCENTIDMCRETIATEVSKSDD